MNRKTDEDVLVGEAPILSRQLAIIYRDLALSCATLVVGNPSGSTNGQRTPVSALWEPVFRMRAAAIFPENFYREPVRPVNRACSRARPGGHFLATPVWVILKPPSFPARVSPPSPCVALFAPLCAAP